MNMHTALKGVSPDASSFLVLLLQMHLKAWKAVFVIIFVLILGIMCVLYSYVRHF